MFERETIYAVGQGPSAMDALKDATANMYNAAAEALGPDPQPIAIDHTVSWMTDEVPTSRLRPSRTEVVAVVTVTMVGIFETNPMRSRD